MRNKSMVGGAAVGLIAALAFAGGAHAHHATPTAEVTTGDCEATITTAWSADEHQVDTAALVVLVNGEVLTAPIGASVTVGPFEADTTVSWRIWGGGERDYDDPPLTNLEALLAHLGQGGSELDPDAPGVAWHSLEVPACPADEDDLEPTPEPTPTTPPADDEDDLEPTPEPTPTTPPADDDDAAGGAGGGDDDILPVTGAPAALLAGGAVLLLAAGGGLYLAARPRRRVSFSA